MAAGTGGEFLRSLRPHPREPVRAGRAVPVSQINSPPPHNLVDSRADPGSTAVRCVPPNAIPGARSFLLGCNMLGWFQALMPREERFFTLFEKHATIIVAGADALRGLLLGGDGVQAYCKQIFQREAEADDVTREVLLAVRRTFITPFDRTDIQDLITSMDDAIDQMNKTAKTIVLFEVHAFEPYMQQMSEIIVQVAKLVLEATPLLSSIGSNAGRLNTLTTKIITLEEEADDICNRGIKALYLANRQDAGQGGAMKFVIGSELYDHLEKVVDRFEDVANEINSIVVDQL
jgi:uncharacterized protein